MKKFCLIALLLCGLMISSTASAEAKQDNNLFSYKFSVFNMSAEGDQINERLREHLEQKKAEEEAQRRREQQQKKEAEARRKREQQQYWEYQQRQRRIAEEEERRRRNK